jgi:hypothetical protein
MCYLSRYSVKASARFDTAATFVCTVKYIAPNINPYKSLPSLLPALALEDKRNTILVF